MASQQRESVMEGYAAEWQSGSNPAGYMFRARAAARDQIDRAVVEGHERRRLDGQVRTDRHRDARPAEDVKGGLSDEARAEHKHLSVARSTTGVWSASRVHGVYHVCIAPPRPEGVEAYHAVRFASRAMRCHTSNRVITLQVAASSPGSYVLLERHFGFVLERDTPPDRKTGAAVFSRRALWLWLHGNYEWDRGRNCVEFRIMALESELLRLAVDHFTVGYILPS